MSNWWSKTDRAILACLRDSGPLSLQDLSHRVGLTEAEVTVFVGMLVREGRVRIGLVELCSQEMARASLESVQAERVTATEENLHEGDSR